MQEYPPWATVVIATKYGEPQDFTSVFPSWPHADLRLATMATQLNLPADFSASTPYPSAGRVKVGIIWSTGNPVFTHITFTFNLTPRFMFLVISHSSDLEDCAGIKRAGPAGQIRSF